jgi:hypothetical protein
MSREIHRDMNTVEPKDLKNMRFVTLDELFKGAKESTFLRENLEKYRKEVASEDNDYEDEES